MAFYNVFREKKRVILVFASLFMGTVTFLSVNGFFGSLDVDNYLNTYMKHDYDYQSFDEAKDTFDKYFIESLSKIEGIKKSEVTYATKVEIPFDETIFEPVLKAGYNRYSASSGSSYEEFVQALKKIKYTAWLYSIDESYIEKYNKTHDNKIDLEAFRNGEIVLGSNGYLNADLDSMINKQIVLNKTENGKIKNVAFGGFLTRDECEYANFSNPIGTMELFISKSFMDEIDPKSIVSYISIDVDKDNEPKVTEQLKKLNEGITSTYIFEAKSDLAKSFSTMKTTMSVFGDGISILLILIGVINFINVMLTGVHSRRKELTVLESIGMTKKQIKKMLTIEGFYYAAITTVIILILGSGILMLVGLLVTRMADYAVFTYPIVLTASIITILFIICLTVPGIVFRVTAKETITERLHSIEN